MELDVDMVQGIHDMAVAQVGIPLLCQCQGILICAQRFIGTTEDIHIAPNSA